MDAIRDSVYTNTPAKRALLSAAVVTLALWYFKPSFFFDDITKEPFVRTVTEADKTQCKTTKLPWYIFVAGIAVAVDLFL